MSDQTELECLEFETPVRTETGTAASAVCADNRCLRDPDYHEIRFVRNGLVTGAPRVPGLLRRCHPKTFTLEFEHNEEPGFGLYKEYGFAVSGLYAELCLPSHAYLSERDSGSGRWRTGMVFPKSIRDLPPRYLGSKLRVRSDRYDTLLDFCRFSVHCHVGSESRQLTVCCKRLCSRPEPLTRIELRAIKVVAANEPYYACSWLEKRILFKWHVGEERFEPFLAFNSAIAVYNGFGVRHDPSSTVPFGLRCWKTPDEDVTNADEIYFKSPMNLAGYKWYEPTSRDWENVQRFADPVSCGDSDRVSERISRDVMNLKSLPAGVVLSSALVIPSSFSEGTPVGR